MDSLANTCLLILSGTPTLKSYFILKTKTLIRSFCSSSFLTYVITQRTVKINLSQPARLKEILYLWSPTFLDLVAALGTSTENPSTTFIYLDQHSNGPKLTNFYNSNWPHGDFYSLKIVSLIISNETYIFVWQII